MKKNILSMINCFKRILPLSILIFFLISCKSLTINVPYNDAIGELNQPSGSYQVGISKTDITLPAGHSMGGYGAELGKINRGHWTRQYATSYYIEDQSGEFMIICSADLWSMSEAICSNIVKLLHDYDDQEKTKGRFKINRDRILIAATHTHHSPGNFASSWGYNLASSPVAGFDKQVFDFYSRKIADSIIEAIDSKEPAEIFFNKTRIHGLSRNRSYDAFAKNPKVEHDGFVSNNIDEVQHLSLDCFALTHSAYAAVNPELLTLSMRFPDENKLGLISFFGMHPTVLGYKNQLISSDVFGVSNRIVENYFKDQSDRVICAHINMEEGDVSVNWDKQNKSETIKKGRALAAAIIKNLEGSQTVVSGSIKAKLDFVQIKSNKEKSIVVTDHHKEHPLGEYYFELGKTPMIGKPSLNGAEDGRTEYLTEDEECFYDESQKGKYDPIHGYKVKNKISALAAKAVPLKIPIAVFNLGQLKFIGLPGETSVMLGNRMKEKLSDQKNACFVISLANDYLSYFTTPSEYNAQHYEGSFTVFGQGTGAFLYESVVKLDRTNSYLPYTGRKNFKVGNNINKDWFRYLNFDKWDPVKELNFIYTQNRLDTNYVVFEWGTPLTKEDIRNYSPESENAVPEICIQVFENERWVTLILENSLQSEEGNLKYSELQDDSHSANFLYYIKTVEEFDKQNLEYKHYLMNEARWMIPDGDNSSLRGKKLRFFVKDQNGNKYFGEPFFVS